MPKPFPNIMGRYIAFEGPDLSGKTTLMNAVEDYLKENHPEMYYIRTREPGGSRISEAIREVILDPEYTEMTPWTETLLYTASRAQFMDEVIEPNLRLQDIILADRCYLSSLVYQGDMRGVGVQKVLELNKHFHEPDMIFIVDIPTETAKERMKQRTHLNRLDLEPLSNHKKVRDSYLKFSKLLPNVTILDGREPTDTLKDQVIDYLNKEILW